MSLWKKRLCGHLIPKAKTDLQRGLQEIKNWTDVLVRSSHGGRCHTKTIRALDAKNESTNFILPTSDYAVLVLEENGQTTFYRDQNTGHHPLNFTLKK